MDIEYEIDLANRLRWDFRKPGRYEVYYLTFNHLESGRAFWIRYTLNSPSKDGSEPYAQVWFSYFDAAEPGRNFALKRKYSIEKMHVEENLFTLWIDGCEISTGHIKGHIEDAVHEVRWDLEYTCDDPVHLHLPKFLYKYQIADTIVLSPGVDAKFSGKIMVDGERLAFDGAPGCQTHIWGKKHAQRWAWGHCNAFDGSPGTVFEGLSVQIRRAGITLPAVNLLFLRHNGREYRFTEVLSALRCRSSFDTGYWNFSARQGNILIRGEISCGFRDLVRADYIDPDGEPSYCHNTEVAVAKITIFEKKSAFGKWEEVERLAAPHTMHVEFAARQPDPRVEKTILDAPAVT